MTITEENFPQLLKELKKELGLRGLFIVAVFPNRVVGGGSDVMSMDLANVLATIAVLVRKIGEQQSG